MRRPSAQALLDLASRATRNEVVGRIISVTGISVEATGVEAALGDLCVVKTPGGDVPAEVVGLSSSSVVLMPIGESLGISHGSPVLNTGEPLMIRGGDACLGRVVDALGAPIDGGQPIAGERLPIVRDAPAALDRPIIHDEIVTGVSAIDGFLTCGVGQRVGIFSGSGIGKSTLLGMIARGASSDVNVIALVGERGREVKEFVEDVLGAEGLAKSVLVVATSDAPPLLRFKATFTAITLAEHFRDRGKNVLFVMDSVTRFALAAREIGLAVGEPPTLRGYPPSLFAQLPKVVERLGATDRGSITGMLTILVEGDDMNEPVSDAMRGLLDGHFVLSRRIAARGAYPAIDVLGSISRLMTRVASDERLELARDLRCCLADYEENRDLIQVGAYQQGSDPAIDRAMRAMPAIDALLYQGTASREIDETLELMRAARLA